jgi:hypothetical protein
VLHYHLSGSRLPSTAAPINEGTTDQQERQEANDRKKQDEQ